MDTRLTIAEPSALTLLESLGLRCYEDYVSCTRGEVVGCGSTSESRRLTADSANAGASDCPIRLYLKVYRYEGRHRRWALLPDKAEIEARNYRILRDHCGLDTPAVLAFGRRSRDGWLTNGFILTREVPGARPLEEYVPAPTTRFTESAVHNAALRQYVLQETADLVSRMHAVGFCHVDLQWRNLRVADGETDRPRIYILDSSRGRLLRWRVRREHGRLRDLSSLVKMARRQMSRSEQIRWLRRYLGVRRLAPEHRVLVQTMLYDRSVKDDDPA